MGFDMGMGSAGGDMLGMGSDFGSMGGLDPFSNASMFDPSMMGTDFTGGMGLNDLMSSGSFGGGPGTTGMTPDVANNPMQAEAQAGDPGDQLGPAAPVDQGPGPDQGPTQQQPQQQSLVSHLAQQLNPVGSANAAEAFTPGGGAGFSDRFNQANMPSFNTRFGGDASPTPTLGGNPDLQQRLTDQIQPNMQPSPTTPSFDDRFQSFAPPTGTPQAIDPTAAAAGAPGTPLQVGTTAPDQAPADVPGTTPDRPGTGDTGTQQPGGQQGGQPGQRGGQGGQGSPIERMLRNMGMPGGLAHLVAQAMAQRMFQPRGYPWQGGFPGRFPFRGGFPGGGRFGGRGFPGRGGGGPWRGPGAWAGPRMSMRSPLPRMRPGMPMPGGGGGIPPWMFQGGGQQPPQDGGQSGAPGSDADGSPSATPSGFAPTDAELTPGAQTGGQVTPEQQQQQQAQPFQVASAGRSAGGVPLSTISLPGGRNVRVASDAAPAFRGFLQDLAAAGAPLSDIGGYNYRNIAGTNRLSEHASGRAIDVNQRSRNVVSPAFQQWARQNADVLRQLTRKYGLVSGGDWRNPDFGHFEMRRREYALNNPVEAFTHGVG